MPGLSSNHTDEHDPPPSPAAPGARLTIRQRVDRELRRALLVSVADLPRRPTEAYDDVARGRTRPAGKLPERLIEQAEGGGTREHALSALREAAERIVNLVHDHVADAKQQRRKAA